MNFSYIPRELQLSIVHAACKAVEESEPSLGTCAAKIKAIMLTNKLFCDACQTTLAGIKESMKLALINKYSVYKSDTIQEKNGVRPQLYDALSTGSPLPLTRYSFNKYNLEIEEDIKKIITLMPESINYNLGELRCRKDINPLYIACVNENIPMHIVEFLLQHKADPNAIIEVSGCKKKMLSDLCANFEPQAERLTSITLLFLQYGYRDSF